MKICGKCGMEYGGDSSFCPYCDERYGVVIVENDVISADFPAYTEEFPPIGEICVKEESFASNRGEIYERNIRLAERAENILLQNEAYEIHKPVKVMKKFNKDGEIILYAKRNPIAKAAEIIHKLKGKKLSGTFIKALRISVIVLVPIFAMISGKIELESYNKPVPDIQPTVQAEKNTEASIPQKITVTSESGLELKLTIKDEQAELVYGYDYEFTNTTDHDIDRFCDEFTGAEYMDKFYALWVFDSESPEVKAIEYWDDSIPQSTRSYPVKPNETVTGYVVLNFRDSSED